MSNVVLFSNMGNSMSKPIHRPGSFLMPEAKQELRMKVSFHQTLEMEKYTIGNSISGLIFFLFLFLFIIYIPLFFLKEKKPIKNNSKVAPISTAPENVNSHLFPCLASSLPVLGFDHRPTDLTRGHQDSWRIGRWNDHSYGELVWHTARKQNFSYIFLM